MILTILPMKTNKLIKIMIAMLLNAIIRTNIMQLFASISFVGPKIRSFVGLKFQFFVSPNVWLIFYEFLKKKVAHLSHIYPMYTKKKKKLAVPAK
jgi:hypothetical protein